jgi:hypothetical protein
MRPKDEPQVRGVRRRGLRLALIAASAILLQASECEKGRQFFAPVLRTDGLLDDRNPLITGLLPVPNTILNDVVIMATITDPEGSNGASASGVDVASIAALGDDGADLAVTAAGMDMYNANIADWSDGLRMVTWSAMDLAGNEASATQTFTIDRTAPEVAVDPVPPASATSDDQQFSWTVGIGITELHFLDASYAVTLAGLDGQCGTGDDVTPTAEQVPTSSFPLDEGSNMVEVVTNNGVPPGGEPRTAIYCGRVTARDEAVTKSGGSASNATTTTPIRTELTWLAPPGGGGFSIDFGNPAPGYCHIGSGDSRTYTGFGTNPLKASASFSITWSGPGLVGGSTRTGSLGANGRGFDEQMINQFGTYPFVLMVTADGVTESASGSVTVSAAQGACQQLSSRRFKREIASLLPADIRPLGLNPVSFRYREPWGDPGVARVGLVAEEVAAVFPEAVGLDDCGRPETIEYRVLARRVVEAAVSRSGHAIEAAIVRMAAGL